MDRRKGLMIGLGALLFVLASLFGLSLARPDEAQNMQAAEEAREETQDVCASADTFQGLKQTLFQQASSGRAADPVNYDILAASAVVRMENPVVVSRDEQLGVTVCRGRLILELPPGAERGFDGEKRLTADVEYSVQEAADGSGAVYRISGADGIVSRLAAFNLQGQQLERPDDVPADAVVNAGDPVIEPEPAEEPEPRQAEPNPAPPPAPRPTETRPAPEPRATPEPRPNAANPSFNCRNARTRGERMVCGDAGLARQDRVMSSVFYSALRDANASQRRQLQSTRNRFLAYRDRCASRACIADAYEGRIREIRDIMAGTYRR